MFRGESAGVSAGTPVGTTVGTTVGTPRRVRCCDLADVPHIHTNISCGGKGSREEAFELDSKFSVTFFLERGLTLPTNWKVGEQYHEDALVILGTEGSIWQCIQTTTSVPGTAGDWTHWAAMSSWKGHWSPYYEYSAGDIIHINDGFYKCNAGSPAGVYPKDSTYISAEKPGRWTFLSTIGQRFPPWMKDHVSTFSADLDMSKTLCIHPNTGGTFWELSAERYIGSEVTPVELFHSSIQEIFREGGESEVTKIFTVKTIHSGKCSPTPTADDPRPDDQNFFGMTMGVYLIPPKKMMGADHNTAGADHGTADMSSLIPMVSPQTGDSYTDIYFQWAAAGVPFIAQPLAEDPTILSSILCMLNRDPHERYTEIFQKSARIAQRCNRISTSAEVFKREYMNECIKLGKSIPQGNITPEYQKWKVSQMIEKSSSLTTANKLWKDANQEWLEWLWKLHQYTETTQGRLTYIAQDFYGVETWINSSGNECSLEGMQWTDNAGSIITGLEIINDLRTLERLWIIMECSVGGLMAYYISAIQNQTDLIDSKIAYYKMRGEANRTKGAKKMRRNKKSKRAV